jgi:ribosomal protein L24E
MRNDDTFGHATVVDELGSGTAAVRHDGLELILSSSRPGGPYPTNFWSSTRESAADEWSPPVFEPILSGYPGNGTGRMQITFDGCEFYFSAYNRPGGYGLYDIYVAKRERLRGTGVGR